MGGGFIHASSCCASGGGAHEIMSRVESKLKVHGVTNPQTMQFSLTYFYPPNKK